MSLTFKPFDEAREFAPQRELFVDAFPEQKGQVVESRAHYLWKFHSFPHAPAAYEYSAYLGDKMVGYYAAIPFQYGIGAAQRTAGMVCDVMTHTQARGQGVFTRLGKYSLDELTKAGVDFVTGYPIRPEVIPGHLKVGWKIVCPLPLYVKFLSTKTLLAGRGFGWFAPLGNLAVRTMNGLLSLVTPRASRYRCEELSRDAFLTDPAVAAFCLAWQQHVANHLTKTPAYYRWRLGAPQTQYRFFVVRESEAVVALAVCRRTDLRGIPSLAILDFMVLPEHGRAARSLHRAIADAAAQDGAEAVATMSTRHWARRYGFLRAGMLRSPLTFKLIVKKLNASMSDDELYSEERWHLMWIDSDDL